MVSDVGKTVFCRDIGNGSRGLLRKPFPGAGPYSVVLVVVSVVDLVYLPEKLRIGSAYLRSVGKPRESTAFLQDGIHLGVADIFRHPVECRRREHKVICVILERYVFELACDHTELLIASEFVSQKPGEILTVFNCSKRAARLKHR